ncbi:hypothetical protein [Actinomycetospora cinnamomea]|uniref:Uncharacterized protein n=1 Tax=Actinomycetospora cinnamomea TaxID=663609 RepID=A0A2U1F436_9PSEU|nr:hypothetical protein [Actinomycetospora cinnamomea]PVZ06922.1 hypothetical protein C8D89_112115 [Actinomycetospora cinnamomea]
MEWDAARTRWRSAADRLWSVALIDEEGYRRAAGGVGAVLGALRGAVATRADLLAVDGAPERVLAGLGGQKVEASPLVVAAACAVRADEIDAERDRASRVALLAAARVEGRSWAVLADGVTRSMSVHVPTGVALVEVEDPYRHPAPYGLREVVLATDTGDPVDGHGGAEDWFADRAERDAALERRRAEIASLDAGRPMVSDEG